MKKLRRKRKIEARSCFGVWELKVPPGKQTREAGPLFWGHLGRPEPVGHAQSVPRQVKVASSGDSRAARMSVLRSWGRFCNTNVYSLKCMKTLKKTAVLRG